MKGLFALVTLIASLSAFAGREQCIVKASSAQDTDVTIISLPEVKGAKTTLSGHNLPCEAADQNWCNFKTKVSADGRLVTFADATLTLGAKAQRKRSGTFVSPTYTSGRAVKVSCKVPVMVQHEGGQ